MTSKAQAHPHGHAHKASDQKEHKETKHHKEEEPKSSKAHKSPEEKLASMKKVKMKFKEDKFYSSQSVAHFEAGKVYEIEGEDQIQRWLKRGGEIVGGDLEHNPADYNPPEPVEVDSKEEASESHKKDHK